MFTGIIEATGRLSRRQEEGTNIRLTIQSELGAQLKPDQSLCHNGVCLTVEEAGPGFHTVVAVQETLQRSALGQLLESDEINLERSLQLQSLVDGHLVQGHVDQTARCVRIRNRKGSWQYDFEFDRKPEQVLVDKCSIAINGVSLTVSDPRKKKFSVFIIPYTYKHTNFHQLKEGSLVNIEFDIIGKYVEGILSRKRK